MARKGAVIVTGEKAIDKKLRKLEPKIQKKVVKKALRAAVKEIILPDAKAAAPIDSGKLEKSLTVRALKRSRKGFGFAVVTREIKGTDTPFYGQFHEFGTKYIRADPYLRPAGYGNEQKVRARLAEGVRKELRALRGKA